MATIVLVPGAIAGGWYMRPLAAQLQAAGHNVFTPTLTGLGERSHLLSREITLDTHVEDIVNVLYFEDLQAVILVGKSYGGMVVTGVAQRVPERLRRLVYVDGAVPQDGETMMDLIRPDIGAYIEQDVRTQGAGWLVTFGSTDPRLPPQPFQTFTQPMVVRNPAAAAIPRTYIYCSDPQAGGVFPTSAQRAREQGWQYYELPTGHDVERTMTQELASILDEVTQA